MKKIIILITFVFFTLIAYNQNYQINSKNNSFTGNNRFTKGLEIGDPSSTTVNPIDSAAVINGDIKFYADGDLLSPVNPDTLAAGDYLVMKADTSTIKTGAYTSLYDFHTQYVGNNFVKALKDWGSNIKLAPLGFSGILTGAAFTDGYWNFTALDPVVDTITLTGVMFWQGTTGDYTADNENRIGLYKLVGTNWELVASTANDGNLWKAANTVKTTVAFSSPYIALPGLYATGCLYNSSAQTTAPIIYNSTTAISSFSTTVLTGDNKLAGIVTGKTTLPTSVAASAINGAGNMRAIVVY